MFYFTVYFIKDGLKHWNECLKCLQKGSLKNLCYERFLTNNCIFLG